MVHGSLALSIHFTAHNMQQHNIHQAVWLQSQPRVVEKLAHRRPLVRVEDETRLDQAHHLLVQGVGCGRAAGDIIPWVGGWASMRRPIEQRQEVLEARHATLIMPTRIAADTVAQTACQDNERLLLRVD